MMETEAIQPRIAAEGPSYGVKIEIFEGPLDLLLYLIRKDELDIYDIPIAHITAQYLSFLSHFQLLDLEEAGAFILMAATLMKIKSQMLLPREELVEEAETEADPREELMRRLLEYQQFKEVADWLEEQKRTRRDLFPRRAGFDEEGGTGLQPVSLFNLLKVYKHLLDHVPRAVVHRIIEERVSVEECIERVLAILERRSRLRFFDLVAGQSRTTLVATFVGLLELLKSQRIHVQQARPFDEIWIEKYSGALPAAAGRAP